MSQNVRTHAHMLKVLSECNPKLQKLIIENGGAKLIHCICEICLNILKGNVSLNKHQKQKLNRHRQTIRTLTNPKASVASKKKILVQKGGGFISSLIVPVLSTLAGLLLKK